MIHINESKLNLSSDLISVIIQSKNDIFLTFYSSNYWIDQVTLFYSEQFQLFN